MDCKKIGNLILQIRKEKGMTQKDIASIMNISDKTISKWERGLGCPDISLLTELSQILGVNIENLLIGEIELNEIVGGNMKKTKFYVCPQCGNIITAIDEIAISCCGCKLELLEEAKAIDDHAIEIENMDDELYISTLHSMSKEHHISFFAFVTGDKVLIIKQYPEWDVHLRLNKLGHGKLYFYCTQHGLFSKLI